MWTKCRTPLTRFLPQAFFVNEQIFLSYITNISVVMDD